MGKTFMLVGQWGYNQSDPMGISTYAYDPEHGEIELVETIREDIVSGQMTVDEDRGIVYVVDEIGHIRGDLGGGGYVNAFRIDPETGKLIFLNEQRTLSTEPCYISLDVSRKYILVCHCSDPYHVTKIRKLPDGGFTADTVYDDTALVLIRLNDDGSLGEVCDVAITEGCGATSPHSETYVNAQSGHIMHIQVISRQHCVMGSPDGKMFAVCDRGMDKIYTFQMDRASGKLIRANTYDEKIASNPRYCAFHPTKPYFYANMEKMPYVYAYRYDAEAAALEKISETKILYDSVKSRSGCSDLKIHPNGKTLYCTSNPNTISVLRIADDGTLKVVQNVDCRGDFPRAICIAPDGKFLFSGNNHSNSITSFKISEDGTLEYTGKTWKGVAPSVIRFYTVK